MNSIEKVLRAMKGLGEIRVIKYQASHRRLPLITECECSHFESRGSRICMSGTTLIVLGTRQEAFSVGATSFPAFKRMALTSQLEGHPR